MSVVRPLSALRRREAAGERKSGYVDACIKIGKVTGEGLNAHVELTAEQFEILRKEYNPRYKNAEHALPSTGKMVKNVLGAARRLAKALLDGEAILRSEAETEAIKEICRGCEFYRKSDGRCSKCGCNLENFLAKTRLETEHCPLPKPKW